jgi:hypothetical protein
MPAGRPREVDPGSLYAVAHQFYWDFLRISEGQPRWRVDRKKQEELEAQVDKAELQLSDEEKVRLQELVDKEIESGRLDASQKQKRLREIEDSQLWVTREFLRRKAAEEARTELRFPGETEVIQVLLDPTTTPERIRDLCKEAVMERKVAVEPGVVKVVEIPAWPINVGSVLPDTLSKHAEQYVAALRDPRFPCCDVSVRPSTRLKQFWFLSRALAGAFFGVSTRTAINLVGSLRPEQIFSESRNAKPVRKGIRRRYKK